MNEKKIISFSGNASVGKTTVMTRIISDLKVNKKNVGYVFDTVRGTLMDMNLLDNPTGRKMIMYKHLMEEMSHLLRKDVEYLLLDRSIIDWYVYYKYECEKRNIDEEGMQDFVFNEASKYHKVLWFQTEGFDYVKDGFRPKDDNLRNDVDEIYKNVMTVYGKIFGNVIPIKGETITQRYNAVKEILLK